MSEAELLGWILGLARELELHAFHSTDPRRDVGPGFPDLFIAGPRGQLLAELKVSDGRLSPDQQRWRYVVQAGGGTWRLYRPADWHSGLIDAEFRGLAVPWL